MKSKILNSLLIITSLLGYLEWGKTNSMFLFQGEYEILEKLFKAPDSVAHPFVLLPLIGQILIFITLFQKTPSQLLTYAGILCLGLLLGFMFIIGVMSFNFKILFSTLPFLIVVFLTIKHFRTEKLKENF